MVSPLIAGDFAEDSVQELETLITKNYSGRARAMALKRLDELIALEGPEQNRIKRLKTYRSYLMSRLAERNKQGDGEPGGTIQDSDGDGLADATDSSPIISEIGDLHWEFSSFTLNVAVKDKEPFIARLTGNLPRFLEESKNGKTHPLSLLGLGSIDKLAEANLLLEPGSELPWTQRNRLELTRLKEYIGSLENPPVSIIAAVDMMFFNYSSTHSITMSKGALPVYSNNDLLFTANCVERGDTTIIPINTRYGMLIRFASVLTLEETDSLIEKLTDNGLTVSFSKSNIELTGSDSGINVMDRLRAVERKTMQLVLQTGSGEISWRVAKSLGETELTVGDALDAINQQTKAYNGRMLFLQNKGTLESIAGVDNNDESAWLAFSGGNRLEQNGLSSKALPDHLIFSLIHKKRIREDFAQLQSLRLANQPLKPFLESDAPKHYYQWLAGVEAGWPEALHLLAVCLSEGVMLKRDLQKSLMFHQLAAERGLGASMNRLGEMYQVGLGVELNDQQAVEWFIKAADKGDPMGQDNLARCYYYGLGAKQDLPEAAILFLKAAGKNHVYATYSVGNMYMRGNGVERDNKIAFDHFLQAATMGCPPAMVQVAVLYRIGMGTEKELKQAFHWFEKAANADQREALVSVGEAYEKGWAGERNLEKAFEFYRKAYEEKVSQAAPLLGRFYASGLGCSKDINKAIECYLTGVKNGDSESMAALAGLYLTGEGVKHDAARAVSLFTQAADLGYLDAWVKLGEVYEFGTGVKPDPSKAIAFYQKAAAQGHADAIAKVGWLYETGQGVNKDHKKAMDYYRDGADKGSTLAQAYLAIAYQFGRGVEKDMNEAVKWLKKAAGQGDPKSMFSLAECYEKGLGTEKDLTTATALYQQSAKLGYAKAQVAVGVLCHLGKVLPHSPQKAIEWWEKAATQNEISAIIYLALIYERGAGVETDEDKARFWFKKAAELGNAQGVKGLERLK